MSNNKELINEEYMNWVQKFLNDKAGFGSDFYKYNTEGSTQEDIRNVKNLEYFYRLTEAYAEKNQIEPIISEGNTFLIKRFYIKYQDKKYNIGYISDQNTVFTLSEVLSETDEETIDFKNIEEYQKQLRKKVRSIKNIAEYQKETSKQKTRKQ